MRKLLITLVVLAGLLVGADFGLAAATEYQVSKQLRDELVLDADPSVHIRGFPFLTQAVSGRYDEIDLAATGVDVGPLDDVGVEATLYEVDASLTDLMSGPPESVSAEEADGRVRVLDTDLGRAIGIDDLRLQPAEDEEVEEALGSDTVTESDDDARAAVRMVATTDLAGTRTEVIIIALLELADGVVRVTPTDVRLATDRIGEVSLPKPLREPVLAAFTMEVEPGGLPFTITASAVYVETGSLIVEGTAEDVTFRQAGTGIG